MTARPLGLFDQETRQRKLQALGDPLVALNTIVPWAIFRTTLESMRSACSVLAVGGRALNTWFPHRRAGNTTCLKSRFQH